jgi:hypothetical protein
VSAADTQLMVISLPAAYAGGRGRAAIAVAIEGRLRYTSRCPNPWHKSSPIRAIELCPECLR